MVLNSTRDKRERIGRILRMHANKREEVQEADAGNIYAAVGLRDTRTGDTLCDEKHPILLEKMIFPEPVISIAIEPKTQGRRREARRGACRSSPTRTRRSACTPTRRRGQTIISGMGELHLGDHRRPPEARVQGRVERRQAARSRTARRSRKKVACEYKYAKQSGGRGQYGHVVHGDRAAASAARASSSRTTSSAASSRRSSSRRSRRASARRWRAASSPATRSSTCSAAPDRRQLPRGRLERAGVRGRGVALLPGRGQARGPGAPRADHEDRGRRPRAVHGRRHRRPELAPRPHPRHEPARQRAGHRRRGPARDDVRLRHGPAVDDPGTRDVLDAVLALRAGPAGDPGRDRREGRKDTQSKERPPWPRRSSFATSRT